MTKSRSKKNDEKNNKKGIVYHKVIQGTTKGVGFPLGDEYYVHVDCLDNGTVKIVATRK